jgi:uncharacterized repeat protein (TIGR01451 family)
LNGPYNVTGDTSINGASVAFNVAPLSLTTLHLLSGTLTGSANLSPTGLFTWTGGVLAGTATPNAIFNVSNTAGIDLANGSTTGFSHQLQQRTLNLPTGTVTMIGPNAQFNLSFGAILHIPSSGILALDQDAGTSSQGIVNAGGNTSSVNIDGTIRKLAANTGSSVITSGLNINNAGTVESLSGNLSITGAYTQTAGVTRIAGGKITTGPSFNIQGGTLLGVDPLTPPGIIGDVQNSSGIVHPGASPGILSMAGNFTQNTAGNLNVDINGTSPGTGYSQLNISGIAALNGALNVTLGGGFTPAAGNSFTVMTFTSHAGDFATLNAPALTGGNVWTKTVTATAVILTVGPPSVPDLSVTKSHTGNFTQGQTGATYTITVSNVGTGPTTGTVTVVDTLPSGLTATSMSGTGWSCALGTLTCTRSDALAAGSSYPSLALTVDVAANAPASLTNSASVSGGGETNAGNNTANDGTIIAAAADVAISTSASSGTVFAGNNLTYTLTITNSGASSASAVTVSDTLPAGVSPVSVASSQGSCTALPCNLGTLASGSGATVTVVVKVAPATRGTLNNTASVAAAESDPNLTNNAASAGVTVNGSADLGVSQTATPSPVAQGSNLSYKVSIATAGPSSATGVSLTDTLPASSTFVSATATQGSCGAPSAGKVTCAIGTMNPGDSVTVTVTVQPTAAGTSTNQASITATESDPAVANNSSSLGVTVTPVTTPDYGVGSSQSSATVKAGQQATYTITVSPQNGAFNNAVTFSLSGLPTKTSFTFSPASVTPGANPASSTLVITTTAATTSAANNVFRHGLPVVALCLPFAGLLLSGKKIRKHGLRGRLAAALVLLIVVGLMGCGGKPKNFQVAGTPAGTYNLTITATAGTVTHTTPITLVVQ